MSNYWLNKSKKEQSKGCTFLAKELGVPVNVVEIKEQELAQKMANEILEEIAAIEKQAVMNKAHSQMIESCFGETESTESQIEKDLERYLEKTGTKVAKIDLSDVKADEVPAAIDAFQQGLLSANEVAEYAGVSHVHTDAEYIVADTSNYTLHLDTLVATDAQSDSVFKIQSVPADINFYTHGEERLKIAEDGGFYVNGKLVTNDLEVYEGFRNWLASVGLIGA